MQVSFVITLYNQLAHSRDRLKSRTPPCPPASLFEIILGDDASTDGPREFLRELAPAHIVLRNEQNLGYAASNNRVGASSVVRHHVSSSESRQACEYRNAQRFLARWQPRTPALKQEWALCWSDSADQAYLLLGWLRNGVALIVRTDCLAAWQSATQTCAPLRANH